MYVYCSAGVCGGKGCTLPALCPTPLTSSPGLPAEDGSAPPPRSGQGQARSRRGRAVACARLDCWNFPPGARRQGSVPGWLDSAGAGGGDFPSLTLGEAGGWSRWGGGEPDLRLEPPRPRAVVLPSGVEPAPWGLLRQGTGKGSSEGTRTLPRATAAEPLPATAASAGRPFRVLGLMLLLDTPSPWTHWAHTGLLPTWAPGVPPQGALVAPRPRDPWGGWVGVV